MLVRNRQLALKVESTEGTAETVAAADADLLVYDPKFEMENPLFDRNPAKASMTHLPGLVGIRSGKISGRVEVRGSGTATTAPSWAKLLKACGFSQTTVKKIAIGAITGGPFVHNEIITGGTSSGTGRVIGDWATGSSHVYYEVVTGTLQNGETLTGGTSAATATSSGAPADGGLHYKPESSEASIPSYTAAVMDDGVKKQIYGARGNLTFEANAGEPGFFGFELQGGQSNWSDVALLSPTYETTIPPVFLSAGFAIDSYAGVISKASFDMGNTVARRTDVNQASGLVSFRITGRAPKGSIDPEMTLVATQDWHSFLRNGTTKKLKWQFDGGADGKRIKIIIPESQFEALGDEDRDGITTLGANYVMTNSTLTDREISILHY